MNSGTLTREMLREAWYKPKLVPKIIGVDETESWTLYDWNTLRRALMRGKGKTTEKEKKYMFFKKIWNSIAKLKDKIEKVYDEIFEDRDFNSRPYWGLKYKVKKLEERVDKIYKKDTPAVDCQTCGCLILQGNAFRGHDRIEREKEVSFTSSSLGARPDSDPKTYKEVVYETWYCKRDQKGKMRYGSHLKDK